MKLPGLLSVRGIRGQIVALVVVPIVAVHLIFTAIFLWHRPNEPDPWMVRGPAQLVAIVQMLGATPATERPRLISDVVRAFPHLEIAGLASEAMPASTEPSDPGIHNLRRHLGPSYRVSALSDDPHGRRIGVTLPDGTAISTLAPPERRPGPFWGGPWTTTLIFIVLSLTLLGLWAARALTAPLSSFATAAENFSLDSADAPLPERGPEEIRSVARALNRMRARITTLIDDRTKMLAAISHDLRTPITRLRLRSEFIEDEGQRRHMLRDLDQMRTMLEAVLSFLRNDRRLEAMTLVDLVSTLQLVTDQFADMGHKVGYDGPGHAMVMARPDDLHRAITNLVENAVRFGAEVTIRLTTSPDAVTIDIEDDGPGISDARKEAVLQPFVRGDDARNMDEAEGFGLGLSIARAVVLAHGGQFTLNDRKPHGLIVRISLPVQSGTRSTA